MQALTHDITTCAHMPEVTEESKDLIESQDSMPTANEVHHPQTIQTTVAVEWGYKILLLIGSMAMIYFQQQTSLAVSQLELKIERQRVEDLQTRPSFRDLERLEKQIEDLRTQLNQKR